MLQEQDKNIQGQSYQGACALANADNRYNEGIKRDRVTNKNAAKRKNGLGMAKRHYSDKNEAGRLCPFSFSVFLDEGNYWYMKRGLGKPFHQYHCSSLNDCIKTRRQDLTEEQKNDMAVTKRHCRGGSTQSLMYDKYGIMPSKQQIYYNADIQEELDLQDDDFNMPTMDGDLVMLGS